MTNLIQDSFSNNLFILRLLGLNPPEKHKILYKIYAITVYCFFITPISVLSCMYLFLEEVDLHEISDNAFLAVQMSSKIFKFLPFLTRPESIYKSIHMLEDEIFTMHIEKHQNIISECIYICKRNCKFFLSFCFFSIIGLGVKPLLKSERQLPLELWLPYDLKNNSWFYYLAYWYILLGVFCGGFSNGALDPLISGLAYQATAQVKILKKNLKYLNESIETSDSNQNIGEINHSRFQQIQICIKHHNAILEFIKNYEEMYSNVVFSQFAASVVVICICCLYLSMMNPLSLGFFAMTIFLITMLSEIFLYCYYGTTLYEENNTLCTAVYMGTWYDYDIQSRKALILLMERSKRPMVITAGKILDLSLTTFTTILRRAYSLLAVLKNY